MIFICNKNDGCKIQSDIPEEAEDLFSQWEMAIEARTNERKKSGCWTPERAVCDCPACGGFND